MTTNVSTTLGWVDPSNAETSNGWAVDNWGAVTASLPAISQFPALVSMKLSNNTVYDTSKTNSMVGYAMVNATTITSSCGLYPNVTYSRNTSTVYAPTGYGNADLMTATPPWPDQIQVLQASGAVMNDSHFEQGSLFLMVSTLLEINPSVKQEVAVPMTWEAPFGNSSFEVYFLRCSLSTHNTTVAIDMQNNTLQNPMPISQSSTQWEEVQASESTLWSIFMGQALSTSGGSRYQFADKTGYTSEPSIVDEYIISLVGLNLTAQYLQWVTDEPPVPNFTLTPDKLEAAIAQSVAQLTWMSSRMGPNGGVPPGEGIALVDGEVVALRLNITLISLVFATSASVIMLGLALHTTRAFDTSHNSQAAIQNTGALQLLWLGHQSTFVHEALEDVKHPTEDNLRRAGMIDICFARTTSDEEELPMRSSTDSLSAQGVDHGRDNGV